ncbi:MAG: UMP kinase [Candidatus Cloacimonetes bacterium]|nr:UMP kinase [Candidatus Cloacimonadota bacterium]
MMMNTFSSEKIHRILLKLSGEMLAGSQGFGYSDTATDELTNELIEVSKLGYSLAIVLGGGNIFRGGSWKNQELNRVVLDSIGMLATIQNALYMAEILRGKGYPAEVFSSLAIDKVVPRYDPQSASAALEAGKICFLSGGTGNPYFTTDTAAVLRAIELKADIVLKATKVDGLYSADPMKDPNARFISSASFQECLEQRLGVMDLTAFSLAADNNMPIKIFNISKPGMLTQALLKADIGTYIHP